jgi:hypothetical protein
MKMIYRAFMAFTPAPLPLASDLHLSLFLQQYVYSRYRAACW